MLKKIIKRGVLTAALSIVALTFASSAAVADPIGRPWSATGDVSFDFGLGGTTCGWSVRGARDGATIDVSTVAGCVGGIFSPTSLGSWPVTWNPTNTGGTIAVALLGTHIITGCLYAGTLNFTYSPTTFEIAYSLIDLVQTLNRGLPCPSQIAMVGTLTI
jgi:hypothetical protein